MQRAVDLVHRSTITLPRRDRSERHGKRENFASDGEIRVSLGRVGDMAIRYAGRRQTPKARTVAGQAWIFCPEGWMLPVETVKTATISRKRYNSLIDRRSERKTGQVCGNGPGSFRRRVAPDQARKMAQNFKKGCSDGEQTANGGQVR